MIKNPRLALAVAFPILCLAALTTYKAVRVAMGTAVVVPITGFDPRDLLSGHFLTYRLDLGEVCRTADAAQSDPDEASGERFVCLEAEGGRVVAAHRLEPYQFTVGEPTPGCVVVLRGKCEWGRFLAGVERFYVPEEHARALEDAVRSSRGAVVLSVDREGRAAVKDLLIEGRPWREAIRGPPKP